MPNKLITTGVLLAGWMVVAGTLAIAHERLPWSLHSHNQQPWQPLGQHSWRGEEYPQVVMDYMDRDGDGRYIVVPHGTTILALTPIGEEKAAPLSRGDHLICRAYNDQTINPPDLKFVGFRCGDRKFVLTSLEIKP